MNAEDIRFYETVPLEVLFGPNLSFSANDVHGEKPWIVDTFWTRTKPLGIPINMRQELAFECVTGDGRTIEMSRRKAMAIPMSSGSLTVHVAYNLEAYGLDKVHGMESSCLYRVSKNWEFTFPYGVKRRLEMKAYFRVLP